MRWTYSRFAIDVIGCPGWVERVLPRQYCCMGLCLCALGEEGRHGPDNESDWSHVSPKTSAHCASTQALAVIWIRLRNAIQAGLQLPQKTDTLPMWGRYIDGIPSRKRLQFLRPGSSRTLRSHQLGVYAISYDLTLQPSLPVPKSVLVVSRKRPLSPSCAECVDL